MYLKGTAMCLHAYEQVGSEQHSMKSRNAVTVSSRSESPAGVKASENDEILATFAIAVDGPDVLQRSFCA